MINESKACAKKCFQEYVTAGVHERLPANHGRDTPDWQFHQQVGNLQKIFEHIRCEDSRRMQEPGHQQVRQLAPPSLQPPPRPEARHSAPIIDPRAASAPQRNVTFCLKQLVNNRNTLSPPIPFMKY